MPIENPDAPKGPPKVVDEAISNPQGTIQETFDYNPEADVQAMHDALNGKEDKEQFIIKIVARRTNDERLQILNKYQTAYKEDLNKKLDTEISGELKKIVKGLFLKTSTYDALEVQNACEGVGTDEGALIEILGTRDNDELEALKADYKGIYGVELVDRIREETSGDFLRLCVAILTASRATGIAVNEASAKVDAQALYDAGEKILAGTDETVFNNILTSRHFNQLKLIFKHYEIISGKTIEASIKSEMSGDLRAGFLTIIRFCRNRALYFAEILHDAMSGPGTNEGTVYRTMIGRADKDMQQIRNEYKKKYGKTLEAAIEGDFTGNGKQILLALLGKKAA